MNRICSVVPNELRVIMCLQFDHRAPAPELAAFKQCIVECASVVQTSELTGAFDFMVEAEVPDLATFNEKLAGLAVQLSRFVARYETSFVCRQHRRENQDDPGLWVPDNGGLLKLDCSQIDQIRAEGDYMRIICGDRSWLVHATMRSIMERLAHSQFVQLHRSSVVRCSFVEELVHQGRSWTARLGDGTCQKIAKGHVESVLRALGADSPNSGKHSPNATGLNEKLTAPAEVEQQIVTV
jgi:DNA-binding LytR/AlgR family response regulator